MIYLLSVDLVDHIVSVIKLMIALTEIDKKLCYHQVSHLFGLNLFKTSRFQGPI